MPESIAQITSGAGPKLHTYQYTVGANNVEDEFVTQGNAQQITFAAPTLGAISTATAASHVVQIMAPASLNVYVRRILVYQQGLATTAAICNWIVLRLTTAGTGGTVHSVYPMDPTDTGAPTLMSLATAKGTEAGILWQGSSAMIQTVPTGGTDTLLLDINFDLFRGKAAKIAAGTANGICLKNITAIAAATVFVVAYLDTAAY